MSPIGLLFMRCLFASVLAAFAWFILVPDVHSQIPKARPFVPSKCDILCDNLGLAIQEHPDDLVMRLEDALVINESCAGEIVQAAITAVNAKPNLVDKIVQTALHVAPRRTASILYTVRHFTPRAPAAALAEEIRKPEVPEGFQLKPKEEVRRAGRVDMDLFVPVEEVRKAEVPSVATAAPTEEIRKAEAPTRASTPPKEKFVDKKDGVSKSRRDKDS